MKRGWARWLLGGRGDPKEAHIRNLVARYGPAEPGFDLSVYRTHDDLAQVFTEDWEFLAHYLERGRWEDRQIRKGPHPHEADRLRGAGRLPEAADLLREVLWSRPRSLATRLQLAQVLFVLGERAEAWRILDQASVGLENGDDVDHLRAFGRYMKTMPVQRARAILEALPRQIPYLDTKAVADRILAAKAQRAPLALIRLGDGEGSCLPLNQEDEGEYRALYERNRRECAEIWFGAGFQPDETGFATVARGLPDVIRQADIVGVPYAGWVQHDYQHGTTRGISCLGNVLKWLDCEVDAMASSGQALCIQLIHIDLAQGGFLDRILQGESRIGLISCHPELPELLKSRYGIGDVEFHKIPGERQSAKVIGADALAGEHFPGAFNRIQARLARPHSGTIFLVAGGILGKFYAATIRQHGGIAIDVGSLADVWVKKATRPGYTGLADLSLGG